MKTEKKNQNKSYYLFFFLLRTPVSLSFPTSEVVAGHPNSSFLFLCSFEIPQFQSNPPLIYQFPIFTNSTFDLWSFHPLSSLFRRFSIWVPLLFLISPFCPIICGFFKLKVMGIGFEQSDENGKNLCFLVLCWA